jgi:PIN domain nuclease of toxin-antitoxin system
MNLLLDTHTLIWFSENDPQISQHAKDAIQTPGHKWFVSRVTYWEMAIKFSIGKLAVKQTLDQIMAEVRSNYFEVLPIEDSHILMVETLPFLHRDPFDRMLIAQALTEDFTLVSNEKLFDDYGVKRIW